MCSILSSVAFPSRSSSSSADRTAPLPPPPPQIFSAPCSLLLSAYFAAGALVGLLLPIAYILHGVIEGDSTRFRRLPPSLRCQRAMNRYKAGDADGWRVPADNDTGFYETWASKIKFLVGDLIVFEYKNDSVLMVSKRGYYHCNETSHDSLPMDRSTVFLLDKPGIYYYVSGDTEHCKKGQRLMVEVINRWFLHRRCIRAQRCQARSISPLVTAAAVGLGCLSQGLIRCFSLV